MSTIKISGWWTMLTDYQDDQSADFLEYGWSANYTAHTLPVDATANYNEEPAPTQWFWKYF